MTTARHLRRAVAGASPAHSPSSSSPRARVWAARPPTTRSGATTPASSARSTPAPTPAPHPPVTIEKVAQKLLPSVTQVNVAGGGQAGSGTGIIISSDGQILTNNHVVESAADGGSITVRVQRRQQREGRDPRPRRRHRPRGHQGRRQERPPAGHARQLGRPQGGPGGRGDRVAVRAGEHGDQRHHQRAQPAGRVLRRRRQRADGVPGDPDRRGDQPRQLRRSARRPGGTGHRHQLRDPLQRHHFVRRRLDRPRLRHPDRPRQERLAAAREGRQGRARAHRRHRRPGDRQGRHHRHRRRGQGSHQGQRRCQGHARRPREGRHHHGGQRHADRELECPGGGDPRLRARRDDRASPTCATARRTPSRSRSTPTAASSAPRTSTRPESAGGCPIFARGLSVASPSVDG